MSEEITGEKKTVTGEKRTVAGEKKEVIQGTRKKDELAATDVFGSQPPKLPDLEDLIDNNKDDDTPADHQEDIKKREHNKNVIEQLAAVVEYSKEISEQLEAIEKANADKNKGFMKRGIEKSKEMVKKVKEKVKEKKAGLIGAALLALSALVAWWNSPDGPAKRGFLPWIGDIIIDTVIPWMKNTLWPWLQKKFFESVDWIKKSQHN